MTVGDKQRTLDILYEELKAEANGSECGCCGSRIWPSWQHPTWKLRCSKGFNPQSIPQRNYKQERLGKMVRDLDPQVADLFPAPLEDRITAPATTFPQGPMTIEEFDQRQTLIKHVVDQMEEGIHYGIIPGTSDKSLWEPGAEYLRAAFNIQWDYDALEEFEDYDNHEYRYKFRVYHLMAPSTRGCGWIASAWSEEIRFKGRPGGKGMEKEMLAHNVRDRALKRGFVALIRNVTGTTGYFKQDLDSLEVRAPTTELGHRGKAEPTEAEERVQAQGDLGDCSEHGDRWLVRINAYDQVQASHKVARTQNEWCRFETIRGATFQQAYIESFEEYKKTDADAWLKSRFGGKAWSKMTPQEMNEAITILAAPQTMSPRPDLGDEPLDDLPGDSQAAVRP